MSRRENKAKIKGWDDAIADAEQRIRDLQFSLRIFKERRSTGEKWPELEDTKEQQKSPQEGGQR